MASKKKPKGVDPATTIELGIPDPLWTQFTNLKGNDRALLQHILRATFDENSRFGMDHIVFRKSTLTKADLAKASKGKGPKKLCEGE